MDKPDNTQPFQSTSADLPLSSSLLGTATTAVGNDKDNDNDDITLTLHHNSTPHTFTFPSTSTLSDLSTRIQTTLSIPAQNQKFLASPRPGLLKPPFNTGPQSTLPLKSLTTTSRKITLLGSTPAQLAAFDASIAASHKHALSYAERAARGPVKAATPAPSRDWKTLHDATTYTFLTLRPLPHLPRPERSLRFLERLRDDAGIKAAMAKHKWTVPLLTEMDPAEHTTHESRTLGLNRNAGEVIELRLRTDAYDGYRDYGTIRKTLCHELAHNVFGEHDRNFWDLCHEIEREVEKGDWRKGGRAVGEEEFYGGGSGGGGRGQSVNEEVADHGSWTGGEFVLGGSSSSSPRKSNNTTTSSSSAEGATPLTRREILAQAAEERAKKQKEQQQQQP